MPRTYQPVKVTMNKRGTLDRERMEHPSFAQIGASRVSATPGQVLYGSDFRHTSFINISIRRSYLERDLSNDWPFGHEELIEVALSESQWAHFVSTLNSGMGTQCTLEFYRPEGPIPGIPDPPDRDEQFKKEMLEDVEQALSELRGLATAIDTVPGLSEARRKQLRQHVTRARQAFESSIPFVATQFTEHMETTKDRAKTEVHAYVEGAIHRAGLAALGGTAAPFEFEPPHIVQYRMEQAARSESDESEAPAGNVPEVQD